MNESDAIKQALTKYEPGLDWYRGETLGPWKCKKCGCKEKYVRGGKCVDCVKVYNSLKKPEIE